MVWCVVAGEVFREGFKKVEELQLTCSTKPTCALSPSDRFHSLQSERDRAIVRHLYDGVPSCGQ